MIRGDEQFHLLVDAVKDYAIFLLDAQGVVRSWNPGAERIKGYRADEIIGQHFSRFYTAADQADGVPARGLAAALAHGRHAAQGTRVRKDGSTFHADVLITPVYKDGEGLVGYAKVTRDVTERHRLEEQLRQRVDALAEADRRKDEYIGMLAHELRNPLAPVFTGVSILRRVATFPAVGERTLQTMERQLKLMSRLVDDLLQISRITRGQIELRREPDDLRRILEHAIEAAAPMLEARSQRLEVRCPASIPLHCDGQRMGQVFSNILHNASKYSATGTTISVAAEADAALARVTIADTGVGIRAEMLERIFELFAQDLRPQETGLHGGLGIGLTLARSVVAMHGGRITARSEGPGRGSQFEIVLPLQAVGDHEPAPAGHRKQFRVLVVDDNVDAADAVRDLLEVDGYIVETAYGGLEALRKAEEMHPHMILLDLLMPDLTGYEVIQRVRRNPGGPVVVAVTGHGSEQDRETVREAGFDEHILKPVIGEEVLHTVRRLLAGSLRPPA